MIVNPSGYWKVKPAGSVQVRSLAAGEEVGGTEVGGMEVVDGEVQAVRKAREKTATRKALFLSIDKLLYIDMRWMWIWLLLGFLMMPDKIEAAKPRNWAGTRVAVTATSGGTPWVRAKLTKWKQYVFLSLGGLGNVESVDYELTYSGNGMEQGVWGTIKGGANVSRELFMGTCSHGVCVAHKNISGIKLGLTYKMKDGKTTVKRYKVRY